MDGRQQLEQHFDGTAAARRLRRQGALEFIARVSDAAMRRHIADHDSDPTALTADAFHQEAVAVLVDDPAWNRLGQTHHE